MEVITKKRMKAYLIDLVISTVVTSGVEYVLRKKVKSEAVHALVTPSMIMGTLECIQLYRTGQTIGYNQMGLVLESDKGSKLTNTQIVKRIVYRDSISTFKYLTNKKAFEGDEGRQLPHDTFAETVVKEV